MSPSPSREPGTWAGGYDREGVPVARKKPPSLPPDWTWARGGDPSLWREEVRPGKTAAWKREAALPFPLPAARFYSFSPRKGGLATL